MKTKTYLLITILLAISAFFEAATGSPKDRIWSPAAALDNPDSVYVQLYVMNSDWSPNITETGQLVPTEMFNCYFDRMTFTLHIESSAFSGTLQIITTNEDAGWAMTTTLNVNHNLSYTVSPGLGGRVTVKIRLVGTNARWGGEFHIEEADMTYSYDSAGNRIAKTCE